MKYFEVKIGEVLTLCDKADHALTSMEKYTIKDTCSDLQNRLHLKSTSSAEALIEISGLRDEILLTVLRRTGIDLSKA